MHATIELLLERAFYTQSVKRGYKEDSLGDPVKTLQAGEDLAYSDLKSV
jgi:hypothetical protein